MRYSILLALSFLLVVPALTYGDDCTGCGESGFGGGGGGPFIRYYFYDSSKVDADFGGSFLVVGGRGYGAVTDWLRIGGGGGGSVAVLNAPDNEDISQSIGFGGLILEPYFELADRLSVSFPLLVGGGGYEFQRIVSESGLNRYTVELFESDFFCLQPGVEVTWTVCDWFGLGLEGGYIWIMDEKDTLTGSAYAGLTFFFGMI